MKKKVYIGVFTVLLVVCVASNSFAQNKKKDNNLSADIKRMSAKIDALSNDMATLKTKYDQILGNQESILSELKKVMIRIRRS